MIAAIGTGLLQTIPPPLVPKLALFSQVDHSNPLQQASDLGAEIVHDILVYGSVGIPTITAIVQAPLTHRYKKRRRRENQVTGQDESMIHILDLDLDQKKSQRASDKNPAMPYATVLRLPKQKLLPALASTRGKWTFPSGYETEPQIVIIARSGSGKNETLLDPTVSNAIWVRPEPTVVCDAKGEMYRKFARRIRHPQYLYSFDPMHPESCSINLVATRRMAEFTAVALYPAGGKVAIYNQKARALFLAIVEYIGYDCVSLVEIYRFACDRARLEEATKNDPTISSIIGGDNKTLVGDIISSLTAPLDPLKGEEVARVFRHTSEQPSLEENMTVWICIPEGAERILGPLAGAIIRNLYERAKTVSNVVRFCIDEAGSCLAVDDLERYLNVGRSKGAYFCLAIQNISQLYDRIGENNTNSALGSAGVHFYGASKDPRTTHYIRDQSGTTRVRRAEYERHDFPLSWEQYWTFRRHGAEHKWVWFDRAVLKTEHVNGLPTLNDEDNDDGWWYRLGSDPKRIALLLVEPMYRWMDDVAPAEVTPQLRGLSRELPTPVEPPEVEPPQPKGQAQGTIELHRPMYGPPPPPQNDDRDGHRQNKVTSRECEACSHVTRNQQAKYCAECGGRLPPAKGNK